MSPKFTIQTVEDFEIDQFVDHILISFSNELVEVKNLISHPESHDADSIRISLKIKDVGSNKEVSFCPIDYESHYIIPHQRIKIAA